MLVVLCVCTSTCHLPPYTSIYRHMTGYEGICWDIRVSGFKLQMLHISSLCNKMTRNIKFKLNLNRATMTVTGIRLLPVSQHCSALQVCQDGPGGRRRRRGARPPQASAWPPGLQTLAPIDIWILAEHRYRRMVRQYRHIVILTPISAFISMIPDIGVHPISVFTRYRV
jgi:hypothetical protein